jgi:hypothetical protein
MVSRLKQVCWQLLGCWLIGLMQLPSIMLPQLSCCFKFKESVLFADCVAQTLVYMTVYHMHTKALVS